MSEAPLVTPLLSLSNMNAMAKKLVVVVTIVVVYYKIVFAFDSIYSMVDCCLKSSTEMIMAASAATANEIATVESES